MRVVLDVWCDADVPAGAVGSGFGKKCEGIVGCD